MLNSQILIVEDEVLVGDLIREILLDEGFTRVDHALNGAEALAMAAANPPRLVFSDVNLGSYPDGIALCALLAESYGCRVIVASGNMVRADRARVDATLPGALIVAKPFSVVTIGDVFRQALAD